MSQLIIEHRDDNGKVYIDNTQLFWDVNNENQLKIDLSEICIIGEYTTLHALHKNEWFMVLVLKNREMLQVSMYAQGMVEVLKQLSEKLIADLIPILAEQREYKSNVIWPLEWAGQELYDLKLIESKTWFDRLRARLGFGNPVELVLKEHLS